MLLGEGYAGGFHGRPGVCLQIVGGGVTLPLCLGSSGDFIDWASLFNVPQTIVRIDELVLHGLKLFVEVSDMAVD
jgi:hypothetical protein